MLTGALQKSKESGGAGLELSGSSASSPLSLSTSWSFFIRYVLGGKAWDNLLEGRVSLKNSDHLLSPLSIICTAKTNLLASLIVDCLHDKERLRQRRKGSPVGNRTENASWPSASWNSQRLLWQEQLPRTVRDCRTSHATSWSCKVSYLVKLIES